MQSSRQISSRVVAILLAVLFAFVWLVAVMASQSQALAASSTGTLYITGTNDQAHARTILAMVNAERAKTTNHHTGAARPAEAPLVWDYDLERAAIQRAAEIAIYYDHTRPNNSDCSTVIQDVLGSGWEKYMAFGENIQIANYSVDATAANEGWTNSKGHYENMIKKGFTCMGAASFKINGITCWVELFGGKNCAPTQTSAVSGTKTYAVNASKDLVNLSVTGALSGNVKKGTTATCSVINNNKGWEYCKNTPINANSFNWTSSNSNAISVDANGKITALASGNVVISAKDKASGALGVSQTMNIAMQTFAEGWKKTNGRWWYQLSDGSYPKSCSKVIGGATYRFDGNGYMRTGWVSEGGNWFYHAGSGAMAKGWQRVGGTWYYLDPSNGVMKTGFYPVGSDMYYSNGSGAMQTGWVHQGGKWYFMRGSGAMAKGWVQTGGTWYYLNPSDGVMKTGFYPVGSDTYYSNGSGAMLTGWVHQGGKWYFMRGSGAMAKGWVQTGGTWYYLNPSDGVMQTGFYNVGSDRYFSNDSGAMLTGWVKDGGKWYFMRGSGAMARNAWISGLYWVGSDGVMATNTRVDNGRYYVDASGRWVPDK